MCIHTHIDMLTPPTYMYIHICNAYIPIYIIAPTYTQQ